ncbi:MAG: hypothetical protein AB4372_35860 [Xenococcus sp. (in: cyanobacteria)]
MLTEQYQHEQALREQNNRAFLENYYDSLPEREQVKIARKAMNHAKQIVEKWEKEDKDYCPF